jgi:valyl-tRNA synthetase
MTYALETYAFSEAGRLIYEFLWDEYADWYIEISKTRMKNDEKQAYLAKRVLIYVWDTCLRLLHPFMPYLTEILWQMIPHQGDSIMLANWPQIEGNTPPVIDTVAINDFEAIKSLVKSVRNARAEYNVEAGKKITAVLQITPNLYEKILSEKASICLLAKLDESKIQIESSDASRSMMKDAVHLVVTDGIEVFLPLSGMIDYDKEIIRLSKQAEKIQKDVIQLEGRLKSKGFVDKAPPDILAEVKNNIETKTAEINNIQKSIASMREMLLKK